MSPLNINAVEKGIAGRQQRRPFLPPHSDAYTDSSPSRTSKQPSTTRTHSPVHIQYISPQNINATKKGMAERQPRMPALPSHSDASSNSYPSRASKQPSTTRTHSPVHIQYMSPQNINAAEKGMAGRQQRVSFLPSHADASTISYPSRTFKQPSTTRAHSPVHMQYMPPQNIDAAEKGMAERQQRVSFVPIPIVSSYSDSSVDSYDSYYTAATHLQSARNSRYSRYSRYSRRMSYVQPANRVSKKSQAPAPKVPVPDPRRWVRFQLWFNTYRKLYILTVVFNIIALMFTLSGIWTYPQQHAGAFILGNILAAIVCRNELFGRLLYLIINTLFAKWTPLTFRLACTSVLQHLGGIHSGCATSGFGWLVYNMFLIFINPKQHYEAVLATGIVTTIAIAICIIAALPWVRNNHHNVFERHHRFVGWFGLLSTWVFVILGESYDPNTQSMRPTLSKVIAQQEFWFALFMTVFVLTPWVTVRKVPVEVNIPSPKVVVLRFERGMQQGLLARISRTAVWEYHAFGIISEGKDSDEHFLICGVQGDFTQGLVNNPPTHIWTRELKFAGVSNTSTLYRRGIRVCTGTGIGAALSTCLQSPDWYLIWIGSNQEKTFGPIITGLIDKHLGSERCLLWDSKKNGGRPDVVQLIKIAYDHWNAEVVFITSNMQGNQDMMEGCKEAGIPAFGTLWDF